MLWLEATSPQDVVLLEQRIRASAIDLANPTVAIGEALYLPLHDSLHHDSDAKPDEIGAMRVLLAAAASAGRPVHLHVQRAATVDLYLDLIEELAARHDLARLRWTLAHNTLASAAQFARMSQLRLAVAFHSTNSFEGVRHLRESPGQAGSGPLIRSAHRAGLPWGLGSDGTVAGQINPFVTLGWAVTGRMVGGQRVLAEPVHREAALIAHTLTNAWLMFREAEVGSIERGKRADLVVLDRDYFTVPEEDIVSIRPTLTLMSGHVVFDG